MKHFIKICAIADLEELKGHKFQLDSITEIAVFKIKDKIYAVDNVCPHNHTPKMYNGFIKNDFVVCPIHLYEFSLKDGKPKNFLGGNLELFETKIEDGFLFVKPSGKTKFNFDF
jgi:nitrite reductase/ring-hydroxylating ferredoxin subunit